MSRYKAMGRKWRCKRIVGGPRGPPALFLAVWPCEAVCGAVPTQVASVPLPATKPACRGPVAQLPTGLASHPGHRDPAVSTVDFGAG